MGSAREAIVVDSHWPEPTKYDDLYKDAVKRATTWRRGFDKQKALGAAFDAVKAVLRHDLKATDELVNRMAATAGAADASGVKMELNALPRRASVSAATRRWRSPTSSSAWARRVL